MLIYINNKEKLFTYQIILDDSLYFFRFALILDHKSKNLILSIRGTASFNDVIIDCVCDEVVFINGFAHRGILQVSMDSLLCIGIFS